MDASFTSVSTVRSHEQIVEQIRDAIRKGSLAQGQQLPTERALCSAFGVSRSVIREAIMVLNALGLVETRQGSGTFVVNGDMPFVSRTMILNVPVEDHAIRQLTELREALDSLAAGRAALRSSADQAEAILSLAEETVRAGKDADVDAFAAADIAFHVAIDEAADNMFIAAASSTIRQMQNEMSQTFALGERMIATAAGQHVQIAIAIRDGNDVAAAELMTEHVSFSGAVLLRMHEGT